MTSPSVFAHRYDIDESEHRFFLCQWLVDWNTGWWFWNLPGAQQSDASIFMKFTGCLSFVITIYNNPNNCFWDCQSSHLFPSCSAPNRFSIGTSSWQVCDLTSGLRSGSVASSYTSSLMFFQSGTILAISLALTLGSHAALTPRASSTPGTCYICSGEDVIGKPLFSSSSTSTLTCEYQNGRPETCIYSTVCASPPLSATVLMQTWL